MNVKNHMHNHTMRTSLLLFVLSALVFFTGCEESIEKKKEKLAELREQVRTLNDGIAFLEKEIAAADSTFGQDLNITLVTAISLQPRPFEHKAEFRGTVESRKNVLISAEIGGRINAIPVREGQSVSRGQVLAEIDAEVYRNRIAELNNALELATTVYERQEKLWAQKIGSEIQYLEAKNRKEGLEKQLTTAKSELNKAVIRAPFNGTIDQVPARVGELAAPGIPLVRMVSPQEMYIHADVSEAYIGKFKAGDKLEVFFPSQNQRVSSSISAVGQVINMDNRTFRLEVQLPRAGFDIKANQVVVLSLRDYAIDSALVIPTNLIQRDNEGEFVYVLDSEDGKQVAKKRHIQTGNSYKGETEILAGLKSQEQVVDKGFRDLSEGTSVKVTANLED
jgi:membrane fusion protein, multidrug efflux system